MAVVNCHAACGNLAERPRQRNPPVPTREGAVKRLRLLRVAGPGAIKGRNIEISGTMKGAAGKASDISRTCGWQAASCP